MKIVIVFLILFSTDVCFGQIGLNIKFKNEPNGITVVTILDSADYVEFDTRLPPSRFVLTFRNDTLIHSDFEYYFIESIDQPEQPQIIQKEIVLLRDKNNVILYLEYSDSWYGSKGYVLNGRLESYPTKGTEQRFVPLGTNVVRHNCILSIFSVQPKSVSKKTIYMKK